MIHFFVIDLFEYSYFVRWYVYYNKCDMLVKSKHKNKTKTNKKHDTGTVLWVVTVAES